MTDEHEPLVFDAERLLRLADEGRAAYSDADPFPHAVFDSFLPELVANRVLSEFPPPSDDVWLSFDTAQSPRKQGIGTGERLALLPVYLQRVLFAFNSYAIVDFLETLTGIEGLIPDPHYKGGGTHQILDGGKLAVHSDFSYHPRLRAYRRINLLLFLNKGWTDGYGGELELWRSDMSECAQHIRPDFNRCAIFNTSAHSLHGHPSPLRLPNGVTRKSLALYYYTTAPGPGDEPARGTDWYNRPGEAGM